MISAYRELFRVPGALAFCIAALVGRMPISMVGLGIIAMLSQQHGVYALAGAVAATLALAMALLGPQVSRLVDRYGQGRVLPLAALLSAVAMLALIACARLHAPAWTLFVCAACAGCMPSLSAMARARWTALLAQPPRPQSAETQSAGPQSARLQTAYALESVVDEVCFIVGPPLSIGLSVAWFAEAGLLIALGLLLAGVGALVLQRRTEPPLRPVAVHRAASPLGMAGIQILLLLMFAMGIIVGTIDVVSVAFADQQGQRAAASIVLSAYAIGSCAAGLLFGAAKPRTPLPRLLLYCGLATALATLPLMAVNGIAALALVMWVAGLSFAPTMIVAMTLVENIVPAAKLTEGLTWMLSGLGVGVALGAGLSGKVVDALGVRAGFAVALGGGALTVLAVVGLAVWAQGARKGV